MLARLPILSNQVDWIRSIRWPVLKSNEIANVCLAPLLRLASLMRLILNLVKTFIELFPKWEFSHERASFIRISLVNGLIYLVISINKNRRGFPFACDAAKKHHAGWISISGFYSTDSITIFTVFSWCAVIQMVNSLFNDEQVFVTEDEILFSISCSALQYVQYV